MKTETITAIATAMSNAGISVIRISGEDSLSIIDKIYKSKNKTKILSEQPTHTIHYGTIVDGDNVIDEVIVLLMKKPNSYTKEDVVEINCHGGITVTKRILEIVIKNGARLAQPGEFTKRAYLNGRIDLSRAEAVSDLIMAKNEFALRSSVNQLKGSIANKVKEIREQILHDIALIEAALDDPEHFHMDRYDQELFKRIEELSFQLKGMLKNYENGRLLTEGIQTVIIGKPNAGKSSLLNLLIGEERAIVTEIAGTTRDTLEETIQLGGIVLNIVDTAGIRDTEDIIEKIGVEKAKKLLEEADFIIYVVDASRPFDENDEMIMKYIHDKRAVVLLNKIDLVTKIEEKEAELSIQKKIIPFSARYERGLKQLEEYIKDEFFQGNISFNDEVYVTNIRHKTAIWEALGSLDQVKISIQDHMPEDFYSIDLMNAYEILGTIMGETVEDDLIDKIFSEFCMGK